jgi:hypothetical protein
VSEYERFIFFFGLQNMKLTVTINEMVIKKKIVKAGLSMFG